MPRDKDLKRLVRTRMRKTGESYTAARAHIVSRKPQPSTASAVAGEPELPSRAREELPSDPAALAGMSDESVSAATGRTWREWVELLDGLEAHAMAHRDIAKLVRERYGVTSWWAQMLTVGYERIKGLRERGQRRGGDFEANKSKTFGVHVDVLYDACASVRMRRRWIPEGGLELTSSSKPRTLRFRADDGTRVALWFTPKGESRSAVAVQHMKLPDRAAADRAKAYWGERLNALADLLRRR